jgi:hypothetical protein
MDQQGLAFFHAAISLGLLLFGFSAIALKKGSKPHRTAGKLFLAMMLGLVLTGSYLIYQQPSTLSVGWVASLAVYLAVTGWFTARRRDKAAGAAEISGALLAIALAIVGVFVGLEAADLAAAGKPGAPVPVMFVIVGLFAFFALLDLSVVLRRGVTGVQRTARHVWRMGLALTQSSAAFLSIATESWFPASFVTYLLLPAAAALILTLFWLARTLWFSGRKGRRNAGLTPSALDVPLL